MKNRGEGPQWTVVSSKKMDTKNVSGPLIIVVQMNGKRKFSHDRHVDVSYSIKDDLISYFLKTLL